VLVVGRIPSSLYWSNCIIEPYTIEELKAIPSGVKAMWNSRDLKTGLNKIETFDEARKTRPDLWLVQASNIRSVSDVDDRANAFIVGSCLVDFVKEYGVK
jgi:indole-3-glycerol phosphate synthase